MSLVILLFAVAYAVIVLAIGVIPLNMLFRKLLGAAIMPSIWRNSLLRLLERTAVAALACSLALAISGRLRGRLTGKGMLALGAAMSGALAGAVDVGLQRLGVSYLVKGPALRVLATYGHTTLPGDMTANSVQLGAQAIFF